MGRPRKSLTEYDKKRIVEILRDPVKWGEFFLRDRAGRRRKFWKHQREDLRCDDDFIIHMDGRETGKSVALVAHVLHYSFIHL